MPRAAGLFNVEWLNANSQRSYPLAPQATKTDISGSFELPDSFIVSLYLPIHALPSIDPGNFFIRSVAIFSSGFSITVGYYRGTNLDPINVASAVIARSTHETYDSYALSGINDFDDTVGKIAIGDISDLSTLPPGQYLFDYAGGVLDPDCIRPVIKGISSIQLLNGSDRSAKIYGDVEFVAGSNFRITPIVTPGQPTKIRFDAIEGAGLNEVCECDESVSSQPIRTINLIAPDANGNINISGSECLEVSPITHGILLKDTCAAPCCGCTELEALTEELAKLDEGARAVRDFLSPLQNAINNFNSVVLGSRLNNTNCAVC